MVGILHVTAPVEQVPVQDGIQFTLRSGGESFTFHIDRQEARAAAAETWRMLDEMERSSAGVVSFRRKR